jgi:hypothetical protein
MSDTNQSPNLSETQTGSYEGNNTHGHYGYTKDNKYYSYGADGTQYTVGPSGIYKLSNGKDARAEPFTVLPITRELPYFLNLTQSDIKESNISHHGGRKRKYIK